MGCGGEVEIVYHYQSWGVCIIDKIGVYINVYMVKGLCRKVLK